MPNYCYYQMCVRGKKENVERFIKVIQADYNYSSMEFSYDRHMFRVFEADYDELEKVGKNDYRVIISGDCAWSVSSCMLNEHHSSYYNRMKEEYPNDFRGTTLPKESRRLHLAIEVYSEECGMCFQEHYLFDDGKTIISECVDYNEYCICDYDSKEEAEEDLDIEITDEEWNSGEEYIKRGGFEEWYFDI